MILDVFFNSCPCSGHLLGLGKFRNVFTDSCQMFSFAEWSLCDAGSFSGWRLAIFGLALVLVMRYRPEGLVPSRRLAAELREAHP